MQWRRHRRHRHESMKMIIIVVFDKIIVRFCHHLEIIASPIPFILYRYMFRVNSTVIDCILWREKKSRSRIESRENTIVK